MTCVEAVYCNAFMATHQPLSCNPLQIPNTHATHQLPAQEKRAHMSKVTKLQCTSFNGSSPQAQWDKPVTEARFLDSHDSAPSSSPPPHHRLWIIMGRTLFLFCAHPGYRGCVYRSVTQVIMQVTCVPNECRVLLFGGRRCDQMRVGRGAAGDRWEGIRHLSQNRRSEYHILGHPDSILHIQLS